LTALTKLVKKLKISPKKTTAATALSDWAEKISFRKRLLAKVLIGNLVEKLEQQLAQWCKYIASADQWLKLSLFILM
jgi:hypothetical protein